MQGRSEVPGKINSFVFHYKGLMDCETEEEFQVQLESLKDVWIEQEKAYLPAGKQPSYQCKG